MREISKKNYILLAVLTVLTIFIVFYMANWYTASKNYQLEDSIMKNFLGEIKESEFENYILENPEIVIYISLGNDEKTKKFDKKLKDYILKEDIKSQFIYLDGNHLSTNFLNNFQKKYFEGSLRNIYLGYPNMFILENGKVIDVLYKLNSDPNIKDVKPFLEKNGVAEDA